MFGIIDRFAGMLMVATCLMACPSSSLGQVAPGSGSPSLTASTEEADRLEEEAKRALEEGKKTDRVKFLEAALAIREKLQGPEHLDTARCLQKLGASYSYPHRKKDSDSCLNRALEIRVKAFGRDHLLVAETLDTMAGVSLENGYWKAASEKFGEALEIKRKVAGPECVEMADSYESIAMLSFLVFKKERKYEDSDLPDKMLRLALKIREERLGPEHPKVANTLCLLATVLYYHSQYEEAETLVKRGLAIYEKVQGPDGMDVAILLQHYARIHRHNGKNLWNNWRESQALVARSKAILKKIEEAKRAKNESSAG